MWLAANCSYGIFVNPDAVIRTVYHKYHHPKEVLISSGVVNREIARMVRHSPTFSIRSVGRWLLVQRIRILTD